MVGATSSGADLVIWHAPLTTSPGAEKPARAVRCTPPLTLDSAAAAEAAVAAVRRAACWRGGNRPPRLLLVVNPASGPGRWAGLLTTAHSRT